MAKSSIWVDLKDNINEAVDSDGNTPLHVIMKGSDFEELKQILSFPNIDVNTARSTDQVTPLILSTFDISSCTEQMVKCLLQHPSIDPNKRDSSGRTALLHAVTRRNTDIVKSLLNHPSIDINIPDSKGNTAWICFVTENIKDPEHEIIQLFLDNKSVDVNKIDGQSGHTGLMHMILKNAEVENIKLLLNRIDIDVNVVTANNFATAGMTALMIAAKYGRVEALKALLQHPGIKVNEKGRDGNTALMLATQTEASKILLQSAMTDINILNNDGYSKLRLSLKVDVTDIAHEIVNHPCYDVNWVYPDGSTDLVWAIKHISVLKRYFTNMAYNNKAAMFLTTQPKVKVSLPDANNCTALSLAAHLLDTDLMKAIVEHPSFKIDNLNYQDKGGKTFVHYLCDCDDINPAIDVNYLVHILQNTNLNINIQDQKGYSPIMYSITHSISIMPDIITCLLTKSHCKCDLLLRNIYDQTVSDIMHATGDTVDPKIQSLINKHTGKKLSALFTDISISDQIQFLRKSISKAADLSLNGKEHIQQQIDALESDIQVLSCGRYGEDFGMTKLERDKLLGCRRSRVVIKLLSILPLSGANAYQSFIQALRETNQEYIADALETFQPDNNDSGSNNEQGTSIDLMNSGLNNT